MYCYLETINLIITLLWHFTYKKALEYTQSKEKVGTLIISGESNHHVGALYLGGYQSSINKEFLRDQHITHIFNTAAGLVNFFGPKYQVRESFYQYFICKIVYIDCQTLPGAWPVLRNIYRYSYLGTYSYHWQFQNWIFKGLLSGKGLKWILKITIDLYSKNKNFFNFFFWCCFSIH